MSQIFNTPGDNLEGLKRSHFLEIKQAVDKATNDLLLHPDWEAVIQCCDKVNGLLDEEIMKEVIFLLRRKLGSVATILNPVSAKQVQLTLNLVEALVKNCGTRLHRGVNDETFMKEMQRVARRYANKSGSENVRVAESALDIIQAWGEGFLTKRRQFPNIVEAYHELKKEGMPFKAQYDPSRVPIFTPDGPSSGVAHVDATDVILAQITSSEKRASSSGGRSASSSKRHNGSSSAGDLPDAIHTSIRILADLLIANSENDDGSGYEVARELVAQVVMQQALLTDRIEALLLTDETDALAALFSLNDEVATVLSGYKGAIEHTMSADQVKEMLRPLASTQEVLLQKMNGSQHDSGPAPKGGDLLDLEPSPRTEAWVSNKPASTGSNADSLLDLFSDTIQASKTQAVDPFASTGFRNLTSSLPAQSPAPLSHTDSFSAPASADLLDFGYTSSTVNSPPVLPAASAANSAPTITQPKRGIVPLLPPPPGPSQPLQLHQASQIQHPQEQKEMSQTNPFDLF